ncbi:flippase [Qipengyuania sp. CAU 1752]
MSIGRNTAYNLAGFGVPLVLFLITIPIYISLIGAARYGVLAIVWLVLGLFGMMDLGLGRATTQRIALLKHDTDRQRRAALGTALACNIVIGSIGALLMSGAAFYLFSSGMKLEPGLQEEAVALVPLMALGVPVMTTLGILNGALQGRERFFLVNRVTIMTSALFQTLPLIVAWLAGPTLFPLVLAALAARIFAVTVLLRHTAKEFGSGAMRLWDSAQMRSMLGYGGWVTLGGIAGMVIVFSDRVLIGAILGAVAVTIYAIPLDATRRIAVLADALANALFPRLANSDDAQSRNLTKVAIGTLYAMATPMVAAFIVLSDPLLRLWLGDEVGAQSAPLARILAIAGWINIFAKPPHARLQAQGRPHVVTLVTLAQLPFFLGGLWWALGSYGLAGAAWIYLARNSVDTVTLSFAAEGRVERGVVLFATFAFFVALTVWLNQLAPLSIIPALAFAALAGLVSTGLGWLIAPARLRQMVMAVPARILKGVVGR